MLPGNQLIEIHPAGKISRSPFQAVGSRAHFAVIHQPGNFLPFAELLAVKKNYTNDKFFGTELYSIIADRTFSGKMIIPKQLRKFYNGIISNTVLQKGYL